MLCNKCSFINNDESNFCQKCGEPLKINSAQNVPNVSYAPVPTVRSAPLRPTPKKVMTDEIFGIIGFICSILSLMNYAIIFGPIALVLSIFGYRKNNTRKLAVAGIIIASISIVLKICDIISGYNIIPNWLFNGSMND